MEKLQNKTLEIFCYDTLYIQEAFRTLVQEFFDDETIDALREYALILKGIHDRLTSEGYVFNSGKFYKKCDNTQN